VAKKCARAPETAFLGYMRGVRAPLRHVRYLWRTKGGLLDHKTGVGLSRWAARLRPKAPATKDRRRYEGRPRRGFTPMARGISGGCGTSARKPTLQAGRPAPRTGADAGPAIHRRNNLPTKSSMAATGVAGVLAFAGGMAGDATQAPGRVRARQTESPRHEGDNGLEAAIAGPRSWRFSTVLCLPLLAPTHIISND
jgi:hypothetical protein